MKYYVASDVHGFYSEFRQALDQAGFFTETAPHKLIVLGDLFDRGQEAKELQDFILGLMEQERVILIRGNHEDLYIDFATVDDGAPLEHHVLNGTYSTALQLTKFDPDLAISQCHCFAMAAMQTPLYQKIIPAARDYYETQNYVFVHGWIPCIPSIHEYIHYADWRSASADEWANARWYNGIKASQTVRDNKTIICGHWHASYGHSWFEGKGSEFGSDAIFSPYFGSGIIAIDACTAHSGIVNIFVLEDEETDYDKQV